MKKTNKTYLLNSVALAGFLSLAPTFAHAAEIDTNTARMQAMDKITGRVSVIDVPVNGTVNFGSFSILVRACKTRPPEDTPENFAFVDVLDNYNTENPVNIFRGWMISSSPALNPVEHPIYDVWLLKCVNTDVNPKKLLSAEELKARDMIKKSSSFEENNKLKNAEEEEILTPAVATSAVEEDTPKEEANSPLSSQLQPIEETKELSAEPINKPAEVYEAPAVLSPVEAEDGAPKSLLNINTDFEKEKEFETPIPSENSENAPVQDTTQNDAPLENGLLPQPQNDAPLENGLLPQPQKDDNEDKGFLSNFVFSEEDTSESAQDTNVSDDHAEVVDEIDKELSDLKKQE